MDDPSKTSMYSLLEKSQESGSELSRHLVDVLELFSTIFIMGLDGQNFPWVEISKSKIIGF